MQRTYTRTTTKRGRNGVIYQIEGDTKNILVCKISRWTLQLKQEIIEATLHGGVENFSGHQDWDVDVEGIIIEDVTKIGEVHFELYSSQGTKVTYKGCGILQGFSLTNEPDKFGGKIMGNGPIKSYES